MTPPPGQLLARHDKTVFASVLDELLVRPAGHLRAVHPATVSAATKPAGRVKAFLRLVMIEHSVFALPFAYIAALSA
ncbi:hypothetical protein ACWD60_40150, partial [Streptomyces sp. NPDC005167]